MYIILDEPTSWAIAADAGYFSGCIHENTMLRIFLRNVEICEIVSKERDSQHMFPNGSKK